MKSLLLLLALLLVHPAQAEDILQPHTTVKHYSFYSMHGTQSNNTGTFSLQHSSKINGYSITLAGSKKPALKDIPYTKTFGGRPPTVHIHLINGRYLIYPETIPGTTKEGDPEYSMLAKLNIFDIKTRKTIHTTKPFRYDHDIPLDYKLSDILYAIDQAKQ